MDPDENPEELVLRVRFYGIRSSGGLCMAAVKQLIEMAKKENLQKVAQVLESAYVDDCNSLVGNTDDLGKWASSFEMMMSGDLRKVLWVPISHFCVFVYVLVH